MLSKDPSGTNPKSKTDKPSKTEMKSADKSKLKASTDKKLESLMNSVTEMQGSLTQLASDFYDRDPGPCYVPSVPRRRMAFENDPDYHGYDTHVGDWRCNFNDYDDWYAESHYSHDYSYDQCAYEDVEWEDYNEDERLDEENEQTCFTTSTPKPSKRLRTGKDNLDEVTPAASPDKEMDDITAQYETTKPQVLEDATTDLMPQQLATTPQTWMWKRYKSNEIKKVQEKARRCSNADVLIPLKIEEEIFHALAPKGKALDARYRFIQNVLMKGYQPIANAWQKIITAITHLQRYRGKDNPFLAITQEFSLDMLQIKAELDLSLRLLGMANSQLALRRHLTMRRHLAPGFKRLCDEHNPLNQWMFGGDIKSMIDDMSKINKIMADAHSYPGRGCGQGNFLGGRGRGGFCGGPFRAGGHGGRRGGRGFCPRGGVADTIPNKTKGTTMAAPKGVVHTTTE